VESPRGVRGMTLQLLELLTTLIQRPHVHEVVKQGLAPLAMTVSNYMLLERSKENEFKLEDHYFL
jgi:hypothetical protein